MMPRRQRSATCLLPGLRRHSQSFVCFSVSLFLPPLHTTFAASVLFISRGSTRPTWFCAVARWHAGHTTGAAWGAARGCCAVRLLTQALFAAHRMSCLLALLSVAFADLHASHLFVYVVVPVTSSSSNVQILSTTCSGFQMMLAHHIGKAVSPSHWHCQWQLPVRAGAPAARAESPRLRLRVRLRRVTPSRRLPAALSAT